MIVFFGNGLVYDWVEAMMYVMCLCMRVHMSTCLHTSRCTNQHVKNRYVCLYVDAYLFQGLFVYSL